MDLKDHQSASTTKLLLLGKSGSGKTGALASLAAAGYNLRILDFDNGADIVKNLLMDSSSPYPKDSHTRVKIQTITDKIKFIGGKPRPEKATVWQRACAQIENWRAPLADGKIEELGKLETWTSKEVLVIDSLSSLSNAAMQFILQLNARTGERPFQSDWGEAQDLVLGMLEALYADEVKCNVIMIAHIKFAEDESGVERGLPNSLGKALPPVVARFFNNALLVKSTGSGASIKQKIITKTDGIIDLKNSNPLRVKPDYELKTGLAEFFADVRVQVPTGVTVAAVPIPTVAVADPQKA